MPTPLSIGKETLYAVEEIAEIYKVSEYTIRFLLREGRIRGMKIDRRWFVTASELKRFRKETPKLGTRGPKRIQRKGFEGR